MAYTAPERAFIATLRDLPTAEFIATLRKYIAESASTLP